MSDKKSKIILAVIIIFTLIFTVSGKTQKNDEGRFQFGFGIMASTGNMLNMIESVRMYQAAENNTEYSFPGLGDKEEQALENLDGAMKRAILVANILGSMDYGVQVRLLWKILMVEADLAILPYDSSYNGRIDLMFTPFIGIRAPFFIMPYAIFGPIFSFSFYPATFTAKEIWRSSWGTTSNFVFRPGLNIRLGLDFKFKNFSIGPYYQYTIKDFEEFTSWYWHLVNAGFSQSDSAGKIILSQSRFGLAICLYVF